MNWNPEDYARNSRAQLAWARELIGRLSLKGSEAVLDVGCGDGKITAEIASALPEGRVVGIDSSPEFISYASANHPRSQFPGLSFQRMQAEQLSFGPVFDVIFSNAALHWVHDHRAFLRGCGRALRRGGRLIISCGGAGNAAGIISTLNALAASSPWKSYFEDFSFPYAFYSPADYAIWLPENGFKTERCELVAKDMTHDGVDGLSAWIRTTWLPYTNRIPEAKRAAFIRDLVSNYIAGHPLDSSGRTHVVMIRLEVEATLKETQATERD